MSINQRPKAGTQADRLLRLLEANPAGLCGVTILENYTKWRVSHRYAATVEVLRKTYGFTITNRPCPLPYHDHQANVAFYVLEPEAASTLF